MLHLIGISGDNNETIEKDFLEEKKKKKIKQLRIFQNWLKTPNTFEKPKVL